MARGCRGTGSRDLPLRVAIIPPLWTLALERSLAFPDLFVQDLNFCPGLRMITMQNKPLCWQKEKRDQGHVGWATHAWEENKQTKRITSCHSLAVGPGAEDMYSKRKRYKRGPGGNSNSIGLKKKKKFYRLSSFFPKNKWLLLRPRMKFKVLNRAQSPACAGCCVLLIPGF